MSHQSLRSPGLTAVCRAALVPLLILFAACGDKDRNASRPVPPAGTRPVSTGVLVQLRLAVEAFDTVFEQRAEEQDLLPMLVHAWSTFYSWPDPPAETSARYTFTEKLCRARLPQLGVNRTLFTCMDGLRQALLRDLTAVTRAYLRAGHADKVGDFSLKRLLGEYGRRLKLFGHTLPLRRQHRAARKLHGAKRCRLRQPAAPVLAITPQELTLNGFPVVTQREPFQGFPADALAGLRHQLESRLLEAHPAGKQPEQLILALDTRLHSASLLQVLRLASGLGVTRICLKAHRQGRFVVPCCLPIRLSPRVVRPKPSLELDAKGLHLATAQDRSPVGTTKTALQTLVKRIRSESGAAPPLILLPGGKTAALLSTVEALQGDTAVEVFPAGTPAKIYPPDPTEPPRVPAPSPEKKPDPPRRG
ncbi:MAG: hypothetical protein ABI333_11855 [bacterium]